MRVNSWTVCHECSSNGALKSALQAVSVLTDLRTEVQATAAQAKADADLQSLAEERISRAERELEIAITALIPLVAKSAQAKLKAREAIEKLKLFEDAYPVLKNVNERDQTRS